MSIIIALLRWSLQVNWLLDHKNFSLAPQHENNTTIYGLLEKGFKRRDDIAFLGYAILFWSVLYFIYDKWLHSLLRRKCFPLIRRKRIVNTIWDCIFCFTTIIYFLYIIAQLLESSVPEQQMKFNLLLFKSYYIHHAGIRIFIHRTCMKGLSDLLFAFFAFSRHWRRAEPSIVILLFLKVIDTTILVIPCRLLLCFWNNRISKNFAKIVFLFHCLIWIYIYMSFVPEYVLWGSNSENSIENFNMWMWFISECLNSEWMRLFIWTKLNKSFEAYLFPPPSPEAVEFSNWWHQHKTSLKKEPSGQNNRKMEILKTLTCVMSVKKKLQRIRKAKEAKLDLQAQTENTQNEEIHDKQYKKKEVMQTLICAMKVRKEIQKIRKEKRNNYDPQVMNESQNTDTDYENSEIGEEPDKVIEGAVDKKLTETSV